jgi:hypothetical protein
VEDRAGFTHCAHIVPDFLDFDLDKTTKVRKFFEISELRTQCNLPACPRCQYLDRSDILRDLRCVYGVTWDGHPQVRKRHDIGFGLVSFPSPFFGSDLPALTGTSNVPMIPNMITMIIGTQPPERLVRG